MTERLRAVAPGRVNLIGDHTDHTGGWVLPMAIDLATTVEFEVLAEPIVELASEDAAGTVRFDLPTRDPAAVIPEWGRYVAGVAAELASSARGIRGSVSSDVPIGGGLSSSAALMVASALALGADRHDVVAIAELCRRAEHRAAGVPSGVMDPLASLAGVAGHALLIDTTTLDIEAVPLPSDVEVVVVDSGVARRLDGSAYADRRARCEAAAQAVGTLRAATLDAVADIEDPVVRAAGRHVVTENRRVRDAAEALRAGDLHAVGALMGQSHASLRDDLDVSTEEIDRLVADLVATPGVHGARLTGAGFGGWVVALATVGAVRAGRVVRASGGAMISPATP